jgi:tetratricopeptide (TPR) repeat protein
VNSLEDLHDEAMLLADQGDAARARQKPEEARSFFAQALALEKQALALASPEVQPTCAVLLRSAACLAIEAGSIDEALHFIEAGLANPLTPGPLREELEELFDPLLGEHSSSTPGWSNFEPPVDRIIQQGARLPPREAA